MRIHASMILLASVAWSPALLADDMRDDELIQNAISAAPPSVGSKAAVVNWDMKTLKEGTNGFTCLPDDPATPTDDPMCLDQNGLAWMHAYMTKTAPPEGKIGFAYMLKGGTAASNTDPYATKPAEGAEWVKDGPHVMVMNAPAIMDAYPHEADPSQAYVMYPDTPYAHLMIPVE